MSKNSVRKSQFSGPNDQIFGPDSDFDSPVRLVTKFSKAIFTVWLGAIFLGLAMLGGLVFLVIHFASKFW